MNDGPQVENGNFTRIHNEIMEALARTQFTGYEFRCVLFLLRMTYGWQKKENEISLEQWCEGIGVDDKRNVSRTLKRLEARHIIYRKGGSQGRGYTSVYGINKYSHQWLEKVSHDTPKEKVSHDTPIQKKKGVSDDTRKGVSDDTRKGVSDDTHKRKKETIKERERTPVGDYIRYYLDNVTETRQQFPTGIEQNTIRRLAQTATLEEWKAACDKTGRQRRGDPLAYIEAVLDGKRAEAAPATVDFDWGAMTE